MTNTWSAKTALSDQEKDCLSNIQSLFLKKPVEGDTGVKEVEVVDGDADVKEVL